MGTVRAGGAATVMERLALAVCAPGAFESVAVTVKLDTPDAVGFPEMTPVLGSSDSPAGRDPEVTDHETGAAPPEDVRKSVYSSPVAPSERLVVTIDSGVVGEESSRAVRTMGDFRICSRPL